MPPLTPDERRLRARAAAYAMHAAGKTNTGPALAGQMAAYERAVDPDGVLDPAERRRRAELHRKSVLSSRLLKAQIAKRKSAEARKAAKQRSAAPAEEESGRTLKDEAADPESSPLGGAA